MENKFGNFANANEAASDLIADGFKLNERGYYTKPSMTGGNLMEAPRKCVAIVEITKYRVDGKWSSNGEDYYVYQQHFI